MTDLRTFHSDHGAVFSEHAGKEVVDRYHRPERTHRAVRNGAGVIDMPYGVIIVEGSDRVDYVDNVVSNNVPSADGHGCYAVILDPQGRIETDLYVFNADDRLLLFTPPGRASMIADNWEVFIEDVEITVVSDEFVIFGVHGPHATEKIASVLNNAPAPDGRLTFVRGSMDDHGVTVVRTDDLAGDPGYEVICGPAAAPDVLDTLVNRGMNAVLFGRETWNAVTLEAGSPLFETELEGHIPNMAGIRNALDFEKGCYVGQEVVSRIENRGRPNKRLVGLRVDTQPTRGAAVFEGDAAVGEVTRAVQSPILDSPIAFAYVDFDVGEDLAVTVDGEPVPATIESVPFVDGTERSGRLPQYPA